MAHNIRPVNCWCSKGSGSKGFATSRGSYQKGAGSVMRSMSVRLIRGFRAISENPALALAGFSTIDLEIKALSLMRGGASRLKASVPLLLT